MTLTSSTYRQWRDVVGVVRINADTLEQSYLDEWARELGLAELLAAVRREADGAD